MRVLVTGLQGTLAPRLADALRAAGHEPQGWDRRTLDPEDGEAGRRWLEAQQFDAIAHLGMGSAAWAGRLAAHAAQRKLPMLFTSSAMVFHHEPDGPHAVTDARSAQDDYGRYKMACEDAVLAAYPAASVVRIGWQIDPTQPGNNMLMALDDWQRREGRVAASAAWIPACSFMRDTAAALLHLLAEPAPGLLHLDSNADEGHGFDRIVAALREQFQRHDWQLAVHEDYRHDQRLQGGGARMPPLSARLPRLAPRPLPGGEAG